MKPVRVSREVIYQSPWMNVYADKVKLPGGRVVDRHYFLDFPEGGVAALVENEKKEILLIQSYRYVIDAVEWEIPAGRPNADEEPIQTAKREVFEETGFETHGHRILYGYYPMNGVANAFFHIVHCKAGNQTGKVDDNEVNDLKWVSVEGLKRLIKNREIRDGFTLISLFLYLNSELIDAAK